MFISNKTIIITLSTALMLSGCGAEDAFGTKPAPSPGAFNLTTIAPNSDKTTTFTWEDSDSATEYLLCRKDTSKPKSCDVLATSTTTSAVVEGLGVIKNLTSEYFVIAKNSSGEKLSNEKSLTPQELTPLIQYIKASNPDGYDSFGGSVALSSDGNTLAVGAVSERSNGTGVNSAAQADNSVSGAGAVYIFRYNASAWTQQAYIKASNPDVNDYFGSSIALSSDGNTLAVGANSEGSNGMGVNSDAQMDNSVPNSGAVYLFRYNASAWTQQAYIKASNTDANDEFGRSVALSSDGNTLAVGAYNEDSNGMGVNSGAQVDNSASNAGAVYLFRYNASAWTQQAYIKASNPDVNDRFGGSVALSSDGNTLAVGACDEDSNGMGVNSGAQTDNSTSNAGAVYLFRYNASAWTQQAYIKAFNPDVNDIFGGSVALSSDGNTLAVGAPGEGSNGTGVNSAAQADNSAPSSGAVYLFRYNASAWTQQAYIKTSNTKARGAEGFGNSVALSSDGNTLALRAVFDHSLGTGVYFDNSHLPYIRDYLGIGAAYLFRYSDSVWIQQAYIKDSTYTFPNGLFTFGESIALSSDGNRLAVGMPSDSSNGIGINPADAHANSANFAHFNTGAVYLY